MSNFPWNITDVDDSATPGQHGGAVELENLKPVTGGSTWKVETPDMSVTLPTEPGGTVAFDKKSSREEKAAKPYRVSTNVVDFCITFLVVTFGTAFFLVVAHDVLYGGLTFAGFMKEFGLFLAGLGIGVLKKGKKHD